MSAYYSDTYILGQNIIFLISSKPQNISSKQTCDLTSGHSIRRGEILTLDAIFSNNLVLFARLSMHHARCDIFTVLLVGRQLQMKLSEPNYANLELPPYK